MRKHGLFQRVTAGLLVFAMLTSNLNLPAYGGEIIEYNLSSDAEGGDTSVTAAPGDSPEWGG